jgi:transcriptional regulator with XRE-family HTH domain
MQFLEDPKNRRNDGRVRIRKLMAIQGVSQRDLADALGWKSHSYLGRFIRGEVRNIDPQAAVTIAHILGVGVDDLFASRASTDARHSVARRGTDAA